MSTTNNLPPSWEPSGNFTKVPNEFLRCPRISNSAKVIGICLMSHKPSYPSYTTLSEYTGVCRDTVSNAVYELVQWGIIEYIKGNSFKQSNKYRIRSPDDWKIYDLNFIPVEKPNRSKKKTSNEPIEVVKNYDCYQSDDQSVSSHNNELILVDFSDCNNTPDNTNRKKSIKNTHGVLRPASHGPRLLDFFATDPRIIKMKSYLNEDYLQQWAQREHKNPGLLWFCNRLIDLDEFFKEHPKHVPEFRKPEFIHREIEAIRNLNSGIAKARLKERLNRYVHKYNLQRQAQIVTSESLLEMDHTTGNWNEGGYEF